MLTWRTCQEVVRAAPETFGVQVGYRRTAGALGNERNILTCAEKGGLDLGIGKEPGTGLPSLFGLPDPLLLPPLPNGLASNLLARNVLGRETPRRMRSLGGAGAAGGAGTRSRLTGPS